MNKILNTLHAEGPTAHVTQTCLNDMAPMPIGQQRKQKKL